MMKLYCAGSPRLSISFLSLACLVMLAVSPATAAIVEDGASQPAPATGMAAMPNSSQEAPVVVLLDFESSTLATGEVKALSHALWNRLRETGGVRLLPRDETRSWLIRYDLHPFMPYRRQVPMGRVLDMLQADYMITGRVDRIDEVFILDYNVFSGSADRLIQQETDLRRQSLSEVLSTMNALARRQRMVIDRHQREQWLAQTRPAASISDPGQAAAVAVEVEPVTKAIHKQAQASFKIVHQADASLAAQPSAANPEPQPAHHEPSTPEPAGQGDQPTEAEAAPEATEAQVAHHEPETPEPSTDARQEATATATPAEAMHHNDVPEPSEDSRQTEAADHAAQPGAGEAIIDEQAEALYSDALRNPSNTPQRLAMLEEAVRTAPDVFRYRKELANEYYRQGRFEACVQQSDAALALEPEASMVQTLKGSAHFELEQFDAAIESNRRAIEQDPANHWARYNLALTLTITNAPEAAAAWSDYIQAASGDPSHAELIPVARDYLERLSEVSAGSPGMQATH